MTRHHHFHGNSGNGWSDPNNWDGGIPDGWSDSSISYRDGSVITLTDNVNVNSLSFTGNGTLTINGGNQFGIRNNGETSIGEKVTIVLDGANITGGDGHSSAGELTGNGTLVIKGGSTVSVGKMSSNIVFDNSAGYNKLAVNWTGTITGTISNLTPGDTIDLNSSDYWVKTIEWVSNPDGSYTIVSPAPNQWTQPTTLISHVTLAPGIKPSDFVWSNGELVCYLRGTPILTADGYVPVESIGVGQTVIVLRGFEMKPEKVTWTGWKKAIVNVNEKHDDIAGWPILIEANAISDHSPAVDIRVTSEHCLYLDGHFIPARMLVNGKSIRYDKSATEYDYFHFETAEHSIVNAGGLLSESFLDTGNKPSFNSAVIGGSSKKTWDDAAAPLNTSSDFVGPIWKRIASRAGVPDIVEKPKSCSIHLVGDDGTKILPTRINGNKVIFQIPADIGIITIHSDSMRPSDAIGPYMDDRRELGSLIGGMTLFGDTTEQLTDYLTNDSGWFDAVGTQRWTNGSGKVKIGDAKLTRMPRLLAIQVDNI